MSTTNTGPLAGIRVLDLADQSGAYCTKLFADLGADVIKIEPPSGDPTRKIPPFYHNDGQTSLYFLHFNTNKSGITLNIEVPAGKELLKKLAATADVMVETFPPGYLDNAGLGYESLKQINPGIVLTSITPFGQTGPFADYKGSDIVGQAMAGLLTMCGWPDRPPVKMGGSQAHNLSSVQAAVGTLVALWQKGASGEGQHVDVSVQASTITSLMMLPQVCYKTGDIRKRTGDEHSGPANGLFPCKDGYVDIRLRPHRWDVFVQWLDTEGMAGDLRDPKWRDPWYRQGQDRIQQVDAILRAFLKGHTMEEICEAGQSRRIEVGAAFTAEQTAKDPQLKAQDFFLKLHHPELNDTLTYIGAPFRMMATPLRLAVRAPHLGEHNRKVYQEIETPAARTTELKKTGNPGPDGKLPFEGLNVLEFTNLVAAPLCGKLFADFGARVIIVENETHIREGVSSRHPGHGAHDLTSLNQGNMFNKYAVNKLSITLNLNKPKALEIARKLVAMSDVVIDNNSPRVMVKWGLSYEELKKIKPDIIALGMPTMGQGPRQHYVSTSWNITAMTGLNYMTGYPDRPPISASPLSHPDVSCNPYHAMIALLAALHHRQRTGQGQFIELSQYNSTICFTETGIFEYLVNGTIPQRMGNRLPYAAPHGVYRCQGEDAWCAISVFNQAEWAGLCRAMGQESLAADPRFKDLAGRMKHADDLDRTIEAWTSQRPPYDVMETFQKAGVPAGVVQNVGQLVRDDPQLKHRGYWKPHQHPEAGELLAEGWGFRLSGAKDIMRRHAPLLGQDNDLVFRQILGLPEEEVDQCIVDGVIE